MVVSVLQMRRLNQVTKLFVLDTAQRTQLKHEALEASSLRPSSVPHHP